jgi:hypothetical protein
LNWGGSVNFAKWNASALEELPWKDGVECHPALVGKFLRELLSSSKIPHPQKQHIVCDFGDGRNLNFLRSITTADLPPIKIIVIDANEALRNGDNLAEILKDVLKHIQGCKLSAILSWDIFNYLPELELKEVIGLLSQFADESTYISAFISAFKLIPIEPRSFEINPDTELKMTTAPGFEKCLRIFSYVDLQSILKGWKVARSLHLRNGLREHLIGFHKVSAQAASNENSQHLADKSPKSSSLKERSVTHEQESELLAVR